MDESPGVSEEVTSALHLVSEAVSSDLRGDEGLETGERPLKSIVEDVAKRFPEVSASKWTIEARFGFAGRRCSFVRVFRFPSGLHLEMIINRRLKPLSREALEALVAHELAHVVLHESKMSESEKDVSMEAVSWGFGEGFRRLFAELCPRRIHIMERTRWKTQIGGLSCAEFCPSYSTLCSDRSSQKAHKAT